MKQVIQLAALQIFILSLVFLLGGCYIGNGDGIDDFSGHANLRQDYEMENKGVDKLRFVAELYPSVGDDSCEERSKNNQIEIGAKEKGKIGLGMKCKSSANLRRFLTITNLNNGREIGRFKFLNPKVKVVCDEIECEVSCDTGTAVCLMP